MTNIKIKRIYDSSFRKGMIVPEWQFNNACEYLKSKGKRPPVGEKVE